MNSRCHHAPRVTTVFVVDDEEDLRTLLARWLATSDAFELVGEADNGADAIEAARQLQPDVVVMDVGLPRGDGEEATRIIGSLCPQTRVLAHTGRSDRQFVLGMIGAGVHGYLVKSGSSEEFLNALSVVAEGGTYLSASASDDVFDHVRTSVIQQRTIDHALQPGALRIALQPIVDIRSEATVGYEALARFSHAASPGPVFDAATRSGRGLDVELAAVRAAVEAAHHLDDPAQFVCVNASPETAMTPAFAEILSRSIPERIVIELTENSAVLDYVELRGVLEPLRSLGFRLAVDDVGGGFSCLSHVHQLRPDLIKVDRYLVQHVDSDGVRQSMVAALATIAHRSSARLVAEGVETVAELDMLRELGIELAQGYLLGVPELVVTAQLPQTQTQVP